MGDMETASRTEPETESLEQRERLVHAVIVTHQSLATVPRCIEALLDSKGVTLRLTVVDNASTDGTAEAISADFPDVQVISNEDNVGFAVAVNQGLMGSEDHWSVVVNPDVVVRPGTIEMCLEHLEKHPSDGMCSVPSIGCEGLVNDRSFFQLPSMWSEVTLQLGMHRIAPASRFFNPEQQLAYQHLDSPQFVDALAGCFTVVERSLWDALGGYDENYFLCGEDLDLGVRAAELGAAPVVLPIEPIVHLSARSFASPVDARVAYLRGRAEFQYRWWPRHLVFSARAIRGAGVLARLLVAQGFRLDSAGYFSELWRRRVEWGSPNGYSSRAGV